MALKQMAFRQPASQEQCSLENLSDDKLKADVSGKPEDSNLEDSTPINPGVLAVITNEVLRNRIRGLIEEEEKPKPSKLKSISTNPSAIVVLSFLLSILLGGSLTYYYTAEQQELARQRSFSDELNKIRIQKIGEVWEKIDENELTLDSLLERVNTVPDMNKEGFDRIKTVVDEDIAIVNKNRFWLGERTYNQLIDYLDITGRYVSDMLLGRPGIDLSETLKEREKAKLDILQIRSMFVTGELESSR